MTPKFLSMASSKNFITWLILYCRFGHVTKVWQLYHFHERSYHNLFEGRSWFSSIIWDWQEVCPWNFCTSVAKGLQLKVRNFGGLILKFVEITGEKLVRGGGLFVPHPPSWIGLREGKGCAVLAAKMVLSMRKYVYIV